MTNSNATASIVLGMGCFWGAEKRMSELPGVIEVESGYANGEITASYEAILAHERLLRAGKSNLRNHVEVVKVSFDPTQIELEKILIAFWQNHNPTQGDRQGNDIGSNYRSAIYYTDPIQAELAYATRNAYQTALNQAGLGQITTEIAPLTHYSAAEDYHQDYLIKNPNGYCGLGGTGVKYPSQQAGLLTQPSLNPEDLDFSQQLIVFESEHCGFCQQFQREILDHWQADIPVAKSRSAQPPKGWDLARALFATPTTVLFKKGKEVARYTGYNGDSQAFWQWLGYQLLTPEQQRIAFEHGTERAFTGSHLDEKRPGVFVDPITGAALFRTDTKYDSGSGWPSFFNPLEGALTYHEDYSHGMVRVEVRSASSGIHLGHVFDDGPAPTYKRYCINGNILKFIAD
ncbi:peptide-methionine (S)-S-oxide reductase MsrA [Thiomicrospira microaerophila]|uniref:peptide-methionine (S)-S-oxide reductase MsrA n=1 Tax=Thiomicrospira microaerophila TaxID=406020 RepID=UPI00200FAD1F|nr:peptide-methionine (S)-S-oxide reductase MsrA [Thiomicrospira microaerophila]